jgi:pimeloyl-ACP methyl ester carboxylesterase
MTIAHSIRFAAATTLAMLAGCMSSPSEVDVPLAPQTIKNIVLVHGAWADGSSWSKVIPLLEKRGFHVVSVQNPLTSLADDAAATERAIALQDGPVLLVGHSYGGAVISEAGDNPKVAGLVYVAAFAPAEGQSAFEQGKPYPTPGGDEIRPDASGFLLLTPKGISEDFAPDLSGAEQQIMTATQGPTSVNAVGGRLTHSAWKTKHCWYIVAGDDRMISPILERSIASNMNADSTEIPSSHVVMLSHPAEVEAVIEKAAIAAAAQK